MNNKSILLRGLAVLCLLSSVLCLQTGCQSAAAFQKQFDALDRSGVTEVEITWKFSHTQLSTAEVDGKTVTTFEHNNAWAPKVRIVRTKPAPAEQK